MEWRFGQTSGNTRESCVAGWPVLRANGFNFQLRFLCNKPFTGQNLNKSRLASDKNWHMQLSTRNFWKSCFSSERHNCHYWSEHKWNWRRLERSFPCMAPTPPHTWIYMRSQHGQQPPPPQEVNSFPFLVLWCGATGIRTRSMFGYSVAACGSDTNSPPTHSRCLPIRSQTGLPSHWTSVTTDSHTSIAAASRIPWNCLHARVFIVHTQSLTGFWSLRMEAVGQMCDNDLIHTCRSLLA
jgi:hypothetical protein